jgi:hypothetical protein
LARHTIEELGKAVGMEKFADQQIVRSQFSRASKLVHGDSLLAVLAYNLENAGMMPLPFAEPMENFAVMPSPPHVRCSLLFSQRWTLVFSSDSRMNSTD